MTETPTSNTGAQAPETGPAAPAWPHQADNGSRARLAGSLDAGPADHKAPAPVPDAGAGRYPDPYGATEDRYWNGAEWIGPEENYMQYHARPGRLPVPDWFKAPTGEDAVPDQDTTEGGRRLGSSVPGRKYPSTAAVLIISTVLTVALAAVGAVVYPPGSADKVLRGFATGLARPHLAANAAPSHATASPTATAPPKAKSAYAPTPGYEERRRPLGFPAPHADSSSYSFMPGETAGQKFIAYDPCRPIHYVVREANAPVGGLELIQEGIAGLSKATGLKFIYDGPTQEGPSEKRKPYQPDVYGDRWAPVLITWTSTEEYPPLASKETPEGTELTLGRGGSHATGIHDGRGVYVSGQLSLNAPDLAKVAAHERNPNVYGAVIAHELAHVAGEGHVDDPEELMNPVRRGHLTGYAAGDLTGLAQLGQGPCAPEL